MYHSSKPLKMGRVVFIMSNKKVRELGCKEILREAMVQELVEGFDVSKFMWLTLLVIEVATAGAWRVRRHVAFTGHRCGDGTRKMQDLNGEGRHDT